MTNPYDDYVQGAIKLKSSKKRSKNKKSKEILKTMVTEKTIELKSAKVHNRNDELTKSEKERQFKQLERLANTNFQSDKTYKEKLCEFNNKMNNLTEHFDIQKVSWTK